MKRTLGVLFLGGFAVAHAARAQVPLTVGALLGRVTGPFGNVLYEARAPLAGEVLYVVGTPPVNEGEPLAFIGRIASE